MVKCFSSGISVTTGISSVATFATFVGLPVSISLRAASLTGAITTGIISPLTKKYQKKLKKVTQLIDIVTRATQALHGLAPKCKLINMHELINKSTNDYVTLLPCKNGANVNNKG